MALAKSSFSHVPNLQKPGGGKHVSGVARFQWRKWGRFSRSFPSGSCRDNEQSKHWRRSSRGRSVFPMRFSSFFLGVGRFLRRFFFQKGVVYIHPNKEHENDGFRMESPFPEANFQVLCWTPGMYLFCQIVGGGGQKCVRFVRFGWRWWWQQACRCFFFSSLWDFLCGANSNIFNFHPNPWGNDPIWRAYFLNG